MLFKIDSVTLSGVTVSNNNEKTFINMILANVYTLNKSTRITFQ